jgi:hypothetical protein
MKHAVDFLDGTGSTGNGNDPTPHRVVRDSEVIKPLPMSPDMNSCSERTRTISKKYLEVVTSGRPFASCDRRAPLRIAMGERNNEALESADR